MRNYCKIITPIAYAVTSVITVSAFLASSAEAQTSSSNSTSSSSSSAQVQSSASSSASGGSSNAQIYLDQRSPGSTRSQHVYSGSYEVRSAPSVQPPSMGSGHPCSLGGSIGFSIIGGGAAGGASRVDEACLLAQMGQGQAALIMIAQRNQGACAALRQVGSIPASSICSASERRAVERAQRAQRNVSSFASSQSAPPISRFVTCSRNERGQLVASKRGRTPYSDEEVANFCRNQ